MLDEKITLEVKEKAEYPPIPKDIYQVELLDITSQQKPTYDTRKETEDKQIMETILSFQFTLLDGMDGETELRGRNIWDNFVPTYFYEGKKGKNKLLKIAEAFYGSELSPEQLATMGTKELNGFIGSQIRVSIEPKTSGDRTFDNIADYLKSITAKVSLTKEEIDKASVKKDDDTEVEEVNPDDVEF